MGIDNAQLKQLVGRKVELYDPHRNKSLTGLVLYAPPQDQRCEYVLAYRNGGGFKYKLLPPHLISSLDTAGKVTKMAGEIHEQVSGYGHDRSTLALGLEALFREQGLVIS